MELTILGGGPAGLAVAYYAHRLGIPFRLFEGAQVFGGLCRTLRCGAHAYDTGAHRVHDQDGAVTQDLRALMGANLLPVKAPSKVWINGKLIDFPPTPLNLILSAGLRQTGRIGLDLFQARSAQGPFVSFKDFANATFGRTLARRFLLNYSEKLWGLPAEELAPEIATKRLLGITLRSLMYEMFRPGFKSSHIDGEFLYPRNGYGSITEAIVKSLPAAALKTEHKVVGMDCDGLNVRCIHFSDGRRSHHPSGRIVSTLPLTQLPSFLGEAMPAEAHIAAGKLRFRHIRLVFLRLSQSRLSENASIYFPDPELCMSRVCEPKNRSVAMAPADETAVVVEVPCFRDDPLYLLPDEVLVKKVIDEVVHVGLVNRNRIIEWRHHFLPNAYPSYSLDYVENTRIILNATRQLGNLDCLGRNGTFSYSHLHDQMRGALDYVGSLHLTREHDAPERHESESGARDSV